MCLAATNILLMRNCNHALVWKMADRLPGWSESDSNIETNFVIELGHRQISRLVNGSQINRTFTVA